MEEGVNLSILIINHLDYINHEAMPEVSQRKPLIHCLLFQLSITGKSFINTNAPLHKSLLA
jgi:hypothetical protein